LRRKLTKSTLALIFFTLLLILSILGMFVALSIFRSINFIEADRLVQKPEQYVLLDNPNSIVLQAINNPNHYLEVRAFEDTQIYGLLPMHNPLNVEYNGVYYRIGFIIADSFSPVPLLFFAGIIVSTIAIVVISFAKVVKYIKNRK
jgi:hypothetical protein